MLTKPRPPSYLAILDEAALRRPVGGAGVMAARLRHVVDFARRPNVDVRVIPFAAGAHTGLDGIYVVLEFAKARTIVHLEHKRSAWFVDVASFQEATDTLLLSALGPADSLAFLASVADDYRKR